LSEQEAFEFSVQRIGQPKVLKREFKKINAPMDIQKIIKLAGIIAVAVSIFCPLFIFLSMLLDHRVSSLPKMLAVAVYATTVATIVFSWKYNHKLLPAIRNQLLRRAVGIVCYGGCLLWIRFGIFHFPPGGLHGGIVLPLFIFGSEWTVMAVFGSIGHGLEKAASKKTEPADLLAGQS